MGKVFDGIDDTLAAWITAQPMWFVATAPLAANGHVNVSPRGLDSFSILSTHRVAWVDFTGSGIETIAHLRENGRVCVMFCSFGQRPRVVRLHGHGSVHQPPDPLYDDVVARHPEHPGARAVITVDIDRVSDSCGYGVPVMDVVGERDLLRLTAEKKGVDGIAAYLAAHNTSLDGLPGL